MRWTTAFSLSVTLVSFLASAATKPTPTPDIPSRVHAYEAAHPGVHHVGAGVSEPRPVSVVKPTWPRAFREPLSLPPIIVIAVITESGEVFDPVLVSQARPDLDAAVLKAVSQWRYEPALLNGKAVPAFQTITITLHL